MAVGKTLRASWHLGCLAMLASCQAARSSTLVCVYIYILFMILNN